MTLSDQLINRREQLLNWILNVDPGYSLNLDPCSTKPRYDTGRLANEIKVTLNQIKSLAISLDGTYVNYQQLARDPLYQSYQELICDLKEFDYQTLDGRNERLSFWINLYNALMIHGVIQNKIKTSVIETQLGILGFFQRNAYSIGSQRFSLSDIEHGVLRANRGVPYLPGNHFASGDPRMDAVMAEMDPRIHFALNCASLSCPPIGVYTPENIQDQLDLAAKNFIQNDLKMDLERGEISLSRIYKWYQVDFGSKKELIGFLTKFLVDQNTRSWLEINHSALKIKYHTYDWKLNSHQL
jgi:hypothetical protein